MKRRGADVVVKALEDGGARFAFGIPGTHNIELYDALERSAQIEPILVTDEQSASFMADAVSRSSGSVGVLNVVPGAGVTHAASGIAEAFMDNIPMVVLASGIRDDTGRAYQLHAIDQLALLGPITKATMKVAGPGELYPTVRKAFDMAREGTPGPVAVEIPANYLILTQNVPALEYEGGPAAPAAVDEAAVEAAAVLLRQAKRPAIYAGYGARGASELLAQVAERLGAPVTTTIQGKGVLPEDHPLWLWNGFGNSAPPFVRKIMEGCDGLLAIGCRFGEVATASYGLSPPENLIHVDINAEVFDKNYKTKVAVEADAGAFLAALLARLEEPRESAAMAAEIAAGHRALAEKRLAGRGGERVSPDALFSALQAIARPDTVYTADSGNGTFLAMEHLRLAAPGRFLAPVDYSCMGYAVPAAVAAKLAEPKRDVVALAGDGALLMTGLELMTGAAYGAAPVVCVLRDGELAQIAQFQRITLDSDTCSVLPPYSVETFAALTNSEFRALERDADAESVLGEAFEIARAGRPVMVDVAIDYSHKTFFTKGAITTNFWRLPWSDRVRLLGRAVGRRIGAG
jgi:acetolactate synthase-1/2/3 large subunit